MHQKAKQIGKSDIIEQPELNVDNPVSSLSPNIKVMKYKTKNLDDNQSSLNPMNVGKSVGTSNEYSKATDLREVPESAEFQSKQVIINDNVKNEEKKISDEMLTELRRDVIYK
jgi:hypothetical protein